MFLFKLVLELSFFQNLLCIVALNNKKLSVWKRPSREYKKLKQKNVGMPRRVPLSFVEHANTSFLGLIFFLLARRTLPKRRDYLQSNVALYMMIVVMIMI